MACFLGTSAQPLNTFKLHKLAELSHGKLEPNKFDAFCLSTSMWEGGEAYLEYLITICQTQDRPPNLNITPVLGLPVGGSVTAGMGIYDAINLCKTDVETYCFGLAASMGAFLLGAGKIGKRHSMPNARIMIHQPLGGASGQAVDIEIQVGGGNDMHTCMMEWRHCRRPCDASSFCGHSHLRNHLLSLGPPINAHVQGSVSHRGL